MKNFCAPLNEIGISYLSFTRVYKSGQRIYLTSEPKILEFNFDSLNIIRAPNEMSPDNYNSNQIIIWSTLPNQSYFNDIRPLHICDHGMYLFDQKNKDYTDSFGFATSNHNESIINSYLSNLGLLRNFMASFQDQSRSMLIEAQNEKIILPFNTQNQLITHYSEELENKYTQHIQGVRFTPKQSQCVSLLKKGFTAKEIGKQLNISFRTVELYVETLKKKLNCKNKSELLIKLARM